MISHVPSSLRGDDREQSHGGVTTSTSAAAATQQMVPRYRTLRINQRHTRPDKPGASTLHATEPAQLPDGPSRPSWPPSQILRPREQCWKTNCMPSRTRHACTHSQLHGNTSPESSGEASSHGSGQRPRQGCLRWASVYHRPCHTSVTNYADATAPQRPDLLQRTHHGLAWTPIDGLYNLCHVAPRDGPMTRTGACSGPSKRYCMLSTFFSLTRSRSHISHSLRERGRTHSPDLPTCPPPAADPPHPASRTSASWSGRRRDRPTDSAFGPQGPASDLYSLGCVLHALVAGAPPFTGEPEEVLRQHRETPPAPLWRHASMVPQAFD